MLDKFTRDPRLAAFMLNTAIGLLSNENLGQALAGGVKGMGNFLSAEMARLKEEEEARLRMQGGRSGGSGGGRRGGGGGASEAASGRVPVDQKAFQSRWDKIFDDLDDTLPMNERMAMATALTYQYFGESRPMDNLTAMQQKLDEAINAGDQASIDRLTFAMSEMQNAFSSYFNAENTLGAFDADDAKRATSGEQIDQFTAAGGANPPPAPPPPYVSPLPVDPRLNTAPTFKSFDLFGAPVEMDYYTKQILGLTP